MGQLEDEQGAVSQLLARLDFDRHNLEMYKRLAEKLSDDESESERAATSIVEAAPLEAAHQTALAELRERQGRWDEAILHWHHVADLRALEPTGLIQLAEAQIQDRQFDGVEESLDKLRRTEWPSRFGDTNQVVRRLEDELRKSRNEPAPQL